MAWIEPMEVGCVDPVKLLYWPRYTNPYQQLFYSAAPEELGAEHGPIEAALAAISADPSKAVCFHLHWLNQIIRGNSSELQARRGVSDFLRRLGAFKRGGGVFAWTVHNLASHDSPHPALDQMLGALVGKAADIVLLHSESAAAEVRRVFPAVVGKELMIRHGNYIGTYPNEITRAEARQRLSIAQDARVLLCLGAIRPYKGIEQMIAVLPNAARGGPPVHLVVAGRPSGMEVSGIEAAALRSHVRLTLEPQEIAPEEMQVFLNAADWMALPYRQILTSGSALLGLSFGVPVIAPRRGTLVDLIEEGRDGLLFDPCEPAGLEQALRTALCMPAAMREAMARRALKTARAQSWANGQGEFVDRIRRVHAFRNAGLAQARDS